MTVQTFKLISNTDPVEILTKALNGKLLNSSILTFSNDGKHILRTPHRIDNSTVSFRFKPIKKIDNLIVGVIKNAKMPGNNIIKREIRQNGIKLKPVKANPKNLNADSMAGGSGALALEDFQFI